MIHNPENVESPGEGYRFLTKEERRKRKRRKRTQPSNNIEYHRFDGGWQPGSRGTDGYITYRTKLTPEELEAEG